jgi:hypothetical protein
MEPNIGMLLKLFLIALFCHCGDKNSVSVNEAFSIFS